MSEDGELEVMDLVSVCEIMLLDVGEVLEEVGKGEGGEVVDLKVDAEVEQMGEIVEGSTGATGLLVLWTTTEQSKMVNGTRVKEK